LLRQRTKEGEFPNVKRWLDEIGERPAVKKAMTAGPVYREDPATITPEEQARRSRHSWPTMTRSSVSVSGWQPRRTSISGMSELTAQWKQAMLTLPPSVLRDLAVEIQKLEVVTNAANQQLSAATREGAIADGKLVEVLLDRALASMELLNEAADTMTRLLDELLKG
jgi:hypothetical protein